MNWYEDRNKDGVPDGYARDSKRMEDRIMAEVRSMVLLYMLAGLTILVAFAIVERVFLR
jgi:hypothetical protein